MSYEIELMKSVCGVNFGSTRDTVHSKLGPDFKEFKKTKFSKNTSDAYSFCHIYYTQDNKLEAVEFFPGAEISVAGMVLPWDYNAIKTWILNIDPKAKITQEEVTSAANGISMYAPDAEIESILFATSEYFA